MYESPLSFEERLELARDRELFVNLDYFISAKHKQATELVEYLYEKFRKLNPTKNQHKDRYKLHIEKLLANLYRSYRNPLMQWVKLDLNENHYKRAEGFKNWSYSILVNLLKFYRETGLIEWVPGSYNRETGKGYATKMKAADKLIHLFTFADWNKSTVFDDPDRPVIVVTDIDPADPKGKRRVVVPFKLTRKAKNMESDIRLFNQSFKRMEVTPCLSIEDKQYLAETLHWKGDTSIFVYRQFALGSLELAGRFFGGFWQNWPKEFRLKLLINGKPVIELDFVAMGPSMLYHMEGTQPIEDPYRLAGLEDYRKLVKKTFNAMVNASTRESAAAAIFAMVSKAKRKGREFPSPYGVESHTPYRELCDMIFEKHPTISKHFYKSRGRKLLKMESDICHGIMKQFINKQMPLPLSVHDSFLTTYDQEHQLRYAMLKSYKQELGLYNHPDLTIHTQRVEGV